MAKSRIQSTLLAATWLIAGGLFASACQQGDVGAPCNHGSVEPPNSVLVTFPALSCSDLLCVYGEDRTVPDDPCTSDDDCSEPEVFECYDADDNGTGQCRLRLSYVLEKSMCSRTCDSDADCKNSSLSNRPVVDDDETTCETGFSCTVVQRLGQFCCKNLCVCNDDLPTLSELVADCQPGEDVYEDCVEANMPGDGA